VRGPITLTIFVAFAFLATASATRAANCPQAEISSAASDLQDTRNALMTLPSAKDTALSRPMQSAIVQMKTQLATFILAYMRCQPENADVDGIEVDLSRLGWARELEPGRVDRNDELPPLANAPGWALSFETRALGQGLLGVSASFAIPCGRDTLLMIFEHDDRGWREIMRVASPPYRDASQSYQAFDYALSQPDDDGDWFLVEKHLPTTCVSTMSGIGYSVLRPTDNPLKPKVLFTGQDFLSWSEEDFGRVSAGTQSFELRFHAFDSQSNLVEVVRRFSVIGQTVTPLKNPPQQ